jgi:hypothetical protein
MKKYATEANQNRPFGRGSQIQLVIASAICQGALAFKLTLNYL